MHEISDFSEASEKPWMKKGVFVYVFYFPVALNANFITIFDQLEDPRNLSLISAIFNLSVYWSLLEINASPVYQ